MHMTISDKGKKLSNGVRVLMITGDRNLLREGSDAARRLKLQRSAVEHLDVFYWGRGALFAPLRARGAYDVVTSQDPFFRGLIAWILARRLRAKLNVQVHADLSSASFLKHILGHIVLRHADTIRVVSQKLKGQVGQIGARGKITVLPVYVDLDRFRGVARQPHDGKRILWIGRFENEKNPLAALSVLEEVTKAVPDAALTMLGTGSLKERLLARARGLPVEFPGWQDPALFLGTADVVLCTSPAESWGASMVEALAAEVPVVSPDVGIAREAGAHVVPREKLSDEVVRVLMAGERGALKLALLPAEEWAVQWRSSLL